MHVCYKKDKNSACQYGWYGQSNQRGLCYSPVCHFKIAIVLLFSSLKETIFREFSRSKAVEFFFLWILKSILSSSQRCHRRKLFGSTKSHSVKGFLKNHLFLTFLYSEEPSFTTNLFVKSNIKGSLWHREAPLFLRVLASQVYKHLRCFKAYLSDWRTQEEEEITALYSYMISSSSS